MTIVDSRGRGKERPILTLDSVIRKDLGLLYVSELVALYRAQ